MEAKPWQCPKCCTDNWRTTYSCEDFINAYCDKCKDSFTISRMKLENYSIAAKNRREKKIRDAKDQLIFTKKRIK